MQRVFFANRIRDSVGENAVQGDGDGHFDEFWIIH
jgi:hypothetical protein